MLIVDPIQIEGGLVSGIADTTSACKVYKGIPFAAPPVGPLRWQAPQPVIPWSGELAATSFGNACTQPRIPADSIMRQFSFDEPPECGMSEDCLYLNVWTPAKKNAEKLPVIAWIFGGGHRFGAGSHPVSDGGNLAAKGAVVVTFNYRVGAFGYLAHPGLTQEAGASGNYASMDVIAALAWIKNNITAFGGDPDCVTVFGQSAGAAHVAVLMASPLAKNLFQRAIIHSSGRFEGGLMGAPMKTLTEMERIGDKLATSWGAADVAQMRLIPAHEMLEAERGLWSPIVDGKVLPHSVQATFAAGDQMPIPLLAGYTENESAAYPMQELQTTEGFLAFADKTFGTRAADFLALYPYETDQSARASSYLVRRDMGFAYQAYRFARLQVSDQQVYLFNFLAKPPLPILLAYHEPEPPNGYGAYHGAELWYAFDNQDKQAWSWTEDDYALAKTMSAYWLNFARTGHPNGAGLPMWPAFNDGNGHAMHLAAESKAGPPINDAALVFFERYFVPVSK